jgi:hypothetical protein
MFNPHAKIIITLREPTKELYSLHNTFVGLGTENIKSFKQALILEEERKKGRHIPKYVETPSRLYYKERIKLTEKIKRYLKYFPKKQIKIIIYDDFRADNKKTFDDIFNFLGLPSIDHINSRPYSRDLTAISTLGSDIINYLVKFKTKKLVPLKIRVKIGHMLRLTLNRYSEKRPLDKKLEKHLKRQFKSEIIKLNIFLNKEKLINRDLIRLWDYDKI